jgi:hypothetical protein
MACVLVERRTWLRSYIAMSRVVVLVHRLSLCESPIFGEGLSGHRQETYAVEDLAVADVA